MSALETNPVEGRVFGEVFQQTVERYPDRDALVFPQLKLRWNWRELDAWVFTTSRALVAAGFQRGEHIGVWATNWPQWVLLQFATARCGMVLVNVNPAYRVSELAYIVDQADLAGLFISDQFKASNYEEMIAEVAGRVVRHSDGTIQTDKFPKLRRVISIKDSPKQDWIQSWSDFLQQAVTVDPAVVVEWGQQVRPLDAVNMQYTSGTTGSPKGALLSHRNLLYNAYLVGERMRFSEQDRLNIPVPFYHCFGCVMGTLLSAVYGATMVVPAEYFDPEATLAAVASERCTALYGVPTMFNAEINHPRFAEYDLSSLRTGIMAGSPCPIELMKQVTTRMHLPEITIAYGLTEASPVITQTGTQEPLEIRVSTVGRALPGLEVRLMDPSTGSESQEGTPGELWVRGHGVMMGYYEKPEATAAALTSDGWLKSGDLATVSSTGHYRITGRLKDMIIRGGENVYPREIEEFLLTHPFIRDVQVVGVPDEHYGEQVAAWVILKDGAEVTADEIRKFCKLNIAHYKVPHYVDFIDQFPLTVTGKAQKFKLRELSVERYHLAQAAAVKTA